MAMRFTTLTAAIAMMAACSPSAPAGDGSADAPVPPAESPQAEAGATPDTPEAAADEPATAAADPLAAGQYCYYRDSADTTEAMEIEVTEEGDVSGTNYGNIHQEEAAYYASFWIELTNGGFGENGLYTFDSVTEVDGDTQVGTMTWSITPETAAPDGFMDKPLQAADCEGLEERIFPPM